MWNFFLSANNLWNLQHIFFVSNFQFIFFSLSFLFIYTKWLELLLYYARLPLNWCMNWNFWFSLCTILKWSMLEDLVVTEIFWQIMCRIMKLEVVMCEVQCYINVYYYFYCWVIYNSFVSQWPMYECFCVPVKVDLFFHRKKNQVLIALQFSLTKSIIMR